MIDLFMFFHKHTFQLNSDIDFMKAFSKKMPKKQLNIDLRPAS